ncbi:ATP-binding protein [Pseudooceanicola sp. LIPI14-2-Ac024]|uniref:sensor histidine kinase n=1 Tax=Pseudooceanicola sp. LIPI14-2-Ac024 TaxID=3344875 RepID=UPI0035D13018
MSDRFLAIEVMNMPLTTVLLNLLSNAIKHHDRADGTVWLDAEDTGAAIEFTVADDGPGIPPEYQERIFEMFQTLRPRDEVDGSGLGLAMVQKYAAVRGGSIHVRSDGTRGSTFTLVWPHDPAPAVSKDIAA